VTGWVSAAEVGPRGLRDLFGAFLTGVTVVTALADDGSPAGFTANSFTSVSLDPPLVLVCVANGARSCRILTAAERFGVNILSDAQQDVSAAFASRTGTRFEGLEILSEPGGPPLIVGSVGSIDCRREQVVQAGDHAIVIGRVLGFRREPHPPLGYYAGGYVSFGRGADLLERRDGTGIVVGGLISLEENVLILRRPGRSGWEIPTVALRSGECHRTALPVLLGQFGVRAEFFFLFSVFQPPGDARLRMFFRGVMTEPPARSELPDGTRLALVSEADAPWSLLHGPGECVGLRRFFRERQDARFGIYWDTECGGQVASIEGEPQPWRRNEVGPVPGGDDTHRSA